MKPHRIRIVLISNAFFKIIQYQLYRGIYGVCLLFIPNTHTQTHTDAAIILHIINLSAIKGAYVDSKCWRVMMILKAL